MTDEQRVQVAIRMKQPALEALARRAKEDHRTRSDMIRIMLAYAVQHMPKGWTP
jgi:hypothetical protein